MVESLNLVNYHKHLKRLFFRLFALAVLIACMVAAGFAQGITNKGKEFWMGYTEIFDKTNAQYFLNISSTDTTNVTVEIPNSAFSQTRQLLPNTIERFNIPANLAHIPGSDTLFERAIHIVSDSDVVVYAVCQGNVRLEASLVLPMSAVGTRYRVMTGPAFQSGFTLYASELMVVGQNDTVEVTITPTGDLEGGRPAGVPYNVVIPPGHVYQIQGDSLQDDLTGSLVEGIDPNVPFAVFAGNEWSRIICTATQDQLYEAMFPTDRWGKEYIALPTPTVNIDYVRVMADQDTTLLMRNGTIVDTLMAGEFFEDTISSEMVYRANRRISVGLFLVTGNTTCAGIRNTDPSMIMLNPNEQMFLDSITFIALDTTTNVIDRHFVHILTRTSDTGTMIFDGAPLTGFQVLTIDPTYSFVSMQISRGQHTIQSTGCGFLAYSIGMGNIISYAYAAGVLLNDPDNLVQFQNISTGSDTICISDTLLFFLQERGTPIAYSWDFGDGTFSSAPLVQKKYESSGTFNYEVIVTYQCFEDTISGTIEVTPTPIVDLGNDTVLCTANEITLDAGNPGMIHVWSTGDTTQTIVVDTTQDVSVIVSNAICFDFDTISVEVPIKGAEFQYLKSVTDRDDICVGDEIFFLGSTEGDVLGHTWSLGDGTRFTSGFEFSYTYGSFGDFIVELLPEYLCNGDTIVFGVSDTLSIVRVPDIDLGLDTNLCFADTVLLDAGNEGADYLWDPTGESSQTIEVMETGEYIVLANFGQCFSSDTIYVDLPPGARPIPNVMTPNDDGINDEFVIQTDDRCQDIELWIYNRWGQLVFNTTQVQGNYWDGQSYSGKPVKEGVYFYRIVGDKIEANGSITVIR